MRGASVLAAKSSVPDAGAANTKELHSSNSKAKFHMEVSTIMITCQYVILAQVEGYSGQQSMIEFGIAVLYTSLSSNRYLRPLRHYSPCSRPLKTYLPLSASWRYAKLQHFWLGAHRGWLITVNACIEWNGCIARGDTSDQAIGSRCRRYY